jgi:hypothetical protein
VRSACQYASADTSKQYAFQSNNQVAEPVLACVFEDIPRYAAPEESNDALRTIWK